ncbi:histidine phosphatase family protein [Candidatus Rhodobacter oscarellae]|uniref:histidine phosphatase family protein n=1 Tax=Candidatus Rhodobacter oscarellae TaxID=1675527 RepID=UPI000670EAD1|nr:histidine phosphatase family protein [Candidatus Rhodobacter lobularis]
MGEIVLIRHGQANSTAKTEEEYDRLSELGHQQAAWLGAHLRAHEAPFDRVLTGSLRRHKETAAGMGDMGAAAEEDARWDEMDYYRLSQAMEDVHGVPHPTPEEFSDHVPKVMAAWQADTIRGRESYASFAGRIAEALAAASAPGARVLCVTSGGVIGTLIGQALGLDTARTCHILLPIRNSSVHRFQVRDEGTLLAGFNAHPHLDPPERAHARTTY